MTVIKICGLKDPEMATFAVNEGAAFIGLIFERSSHRFVEIEQAKEIAIAVKEVGATPVGVFTSHRASEIEEIRATTGLECVQLHGKKAREAHLHLPSHLMRLFTCHVEESGAILEENLIGLDPKRDFIFYDGVTPGSGHAFDWEAFTPTSSFRFFLAGGLTPSNVTKAIKLKHPTGVDVSSGVENPKTRQKDKELIRSFIQSVREAL